MSWRGRHEDSGPENPMSDGTLMTPSPRDKGCGGRGGKSSNARLYVDPRMHLLMQRK